MPRNRLWIPVVGALVGALLVAGLARLTHREAAPRQTATEPAPAAGSVEPTTAMSAARAAHTATRLADGTVLVAGGCVTGTCDPGPETATAERFDPATSRFRTAGLLVAPRVGHTATLLDDGRVLLVGGWVGGQTNASAEVWDPSTDRFAATGGMRQARGGHTATRLADGRVLVAGGFEGTHSVASCEIYDPKAGVFVATGALREPRSAHTATALLDGRVLVTGGGSGVAGGEVLASAEVFDAATSLWETTGALGVRRYKHAAALLPDGRVLVLGGADERDRGGRYASAEIYDPQRGRFEATPPMHAARFKLADAVAVLPGGEVLVAGGGRTPEIWDAADGAFHPTSGDLGAEWAFQTATPLTDGRVLLVGGYDAFVHITGAAWLFQR